MVRKVSKLAFLGGALSAFLVGISLLMRKNNRNNTHNSTREQQTADDEYYEVLETALRSAEETGNIRQHKKDRYWNKWKNWIPTLTLVAVVIYSGLTYLLWADSGTSVKTAQEQLAATREEQRPWLTIMIENPDIRVTRKDVSFSGMLSARNVGHLPAFDLRFFAMITVANHDSALAALEQRACVEAVSPRSPWGRAGVVFPDGHSSQYVENYIPRDFLISINVAPQISVVRNDYDTTPVPALFHLISCVAYKIPDDTLIHYSAFVSLLGGPSPKGMKNTIIGTDNGLVDSSDPAQVSDPEGVLLMDTPSSIDVNTPHHFRNTDLHLRELSQFTAAN